MSCGATTRTRWCRGTRSRGRTASSTARSCPGRAPSSECSARTGGTATPTCTWAAARTACGGTSATRAIRFVDEDGEPKKPILYGYDPRVVKIEDDHYVTWCNYFHGPTIGVARTRDFETFVQLENAFVPFNRNGVLFPRRLGGLYTMLSRPSDNGHTPFGDIYLSQSPDMTFWGRHRLVLKAAPLLVEEHQARGRPHSHRDERGLAPHLPRGLPDVQRPRLQHRGRAAGPRRPLTCPGGLRRVPAHPSGALRDAGLRGQRDLPLREPPGPRRPAGSPSSTGPPTPPAPWPSPTSTR